MQIWNKKVNGKKTVLLLFLKLTQAPSFIRNDSVWPIISPISNNFPRPNGDPKPSRQYVHFYGPHLSRSQGHVRLKRPRFGVAFVIWLLPHNLGFRLVGQEIVCNRSWRAHSDIDIEKVVETNTGTLKT